MANEVFDFVWEIPKSGYQWVQTRVATDEDGQSKIERKRQWVLTSGIALGHHYTCWRYAPLRKFTGLFRTFAETALTREGIFGFANKYGSLGIGVPLGMMAPAEPKRFLGVWGETHTAWIKEIDSLNRAVRIWDLARTKNKAELKKYLRWQRTSTGEYWIYDSQPESPVLNEKRRKATTPLPVRYQQLIEPVLDLLKPDDIITPALFLIQRWINKQIKNHVSPRLVYHTDLRKHVLRFVPESLLGALWLQFSQAIDADKEYRACKECGKWFEIALEGDGRTKRRLFCSGPCKSKDYRERRSRARQMRMEGKSIRAIVKELQTDGITIKKWLLGNGV